MIVLGSRIISFLKYKTVMIVVFLTMVFASELTGKVNGQTPDVDNSWTTIVDDNFTSFDNQTWYRYNSVGVNKDTKEELFIYKNGNTYINELLPWGAANNGILFFKLEKYSNGYPHPGDDSCILDLHYRHYYKTGRILSTHKYQYGYFEMTASLPVAYRSFPAFWLWSCENNIYNEIDIFEVFGGWSDTISTNTHWDFSGSCSADLNSSRVDICSSNLSQFHKYALEWTKSRLIWFVDGKIVRVEANDYNGIGLQNAMELIINLARYPDGIKPPNAEVNTNYPQYMMVSNVKICEMKCDSTSIVWDIPNFYTYNYALKKIISLGNNTTIPNNTSISLRATDYIEWRDGFEIPIGTNVYFEVGHYK